MAGLGASKEGLRLPEFQKFVFGSLARIRSSGWAPIRWHCSEGAPLPKPDGKTCWVHLLDPMGKLVMTSLMHQRGPGLFGDCDH
eukprot:795729-Pyramimonas_sp.AAC.1